MATFITTIRFTEKGAQAIQDSPNRAVAFKSAAKKMGVKVIDVYWTLGPFDGVILCEAADDASVTAAMLQLSSRGNVHTSTCRAFDEKEMEKVVGKLGKSK